MRTALSCLVVALLLAPRVEAQSLGALAAQEKVRREKEKKAKAAKVYTEEDLENRGGRAGSSESTPGSSSVSSEAALPAPAEGSALEPGEDAPMQARVAEAQAGLESARQGASAAEAEVERLKQDLNPMSVTFKTDPYEILPLQAALTEAQARAAEAQTQVRAAEAAMEAVRDEARRAGVRVP